MWAHEPILLILSVAILVRWRFLAGTLGVPLGYGNDATTYQQLAYQFDWHHPYATHYREPVFVWFQYLVFKLFGSSDLHYRLTSIAMSIGNAALGYFFSWQMSKDRRVAFLSGLLLAVGDFVSYMSVKGDRNDTYTLFVLAFCLACLRFSGRNWLEEVLLGLLGAAVGLVWLIGAFPVGLIYLWRAWTLRLGFRRVLLFFGVFVALLAPHLLYERQENGDAFYVINAASNYFQSHKVSDASLPATGDTNTGQWSRFLKQVGLVALTKDLAKGYFELFFNFKNNFNRSFLGFHYSNRYSYFLFPFFIWGILASIRKCQWDIFVYMVSFLNVMPAFQYSAWPRHLLHVGPFFAYFFASGFVAFLTSVLLVAQRLDRRE
jgi:hypothetical protein